MADDILAEALARVEHKLDAIINHFKIKSQPVHFPGQVCPTCQSFIDYQVDVLKGVVVRKCKCSTGKMAPTISLLPVPTIKEVKNGSATVSGNPDVVFVGETSTKNRSGR